MKVWVLVVIAACGEQVEPPQPPDAGDPIVIPATGVAFPLISLDAYSYTVDFGLGGQHFAMLVDTGSTSTAVASVDCPDCAVTPLYKPGNGASGVGATASTYYADGSGWSGDVWDDTARMTGLPAVAFDFAAITAQMQFFDQNSYQGLLGLGPASLLEPGTISYMDRLAAGGVPEVMAFRLCPDRGDMWIGGFDPSAAAAPMRYTPMVPLDDQYNPFYSVRIAGVALGGADLGLSVASFGTVVVDTGTSISYIPTAAENVMLAALNNNAAFKALFPNQHLADTELGACVKAPGVTPAIVDAQLPELAVRFPSKDGGTFTIELPPSQSYLVGDGAGGFCWSFTSSGTVADGSTIGDTLLAGMVTVFDPKQRQLGFAPQRGCSEAIARVSPWSSPYFRPPRRR